MLAYSEKFRGKLLAKALVPGANVTGVARQAGIPKQTLFTWIEQAKIGSVSSRSKKKRGRPRNSSKWSPEEKLRLLTESAALSDEELGAFLREEDLHESDLGEIRAAALVRNVLRDRVRKRSESSNSSVNSIEKRRPWRKPQPCWCSQKST